MRLGEAITETAKLIRENPVPTLAYSVPSSIDDCCYKNIVLAENPSVTDPLRNDKNDLHWFFNNAYSSGVMVLQKFIDGIWMDVRDLNDNTYGTFSAFGYFTNDFGEKGMGYLIDWQKVLIDTVAPDEDPFTPLGEGKYRIKATGSGAISGNNDLYSWEYCLWTWTQWREDGTLKFEWYMNGKTGDPFNKKKQRDFGIQNRYNQIRLFGDFTQPTAPYESDYVHYQSETPGFGKMVRIKDGFFDEFEVTLQPIPYYIHQFLKHDMMLSDNLCISDFNQANPQRLIQMPVKPATNWEATWRYRNKNTSVELKFEDLYRNNSHKYS